MSKETSSGADGTHQEWTETALGEKETALKVCLPQHSIPGSPKYRKQLCGQSGKPPPESLFFSPSSSAPGTGMNGWIMTNCTCGRKFRYIPTGFHQKWVKSNT